MLNLVINGYGFQCSYKCVTFKQQVYFNEYQIHHIKPVVLTKLGEESNIFKSQNYKGYQNHIFE
jgi:hypothetical protein